MGRLLLGFVTPDLSHAGEVTEALLRTLAFGFTGVALGAAAGFLLALAFGRRIVRVFCAFVRAIHELFWALIFLQFLGLHPLTGVLAIAIPFAGIFGKVYAELLAETDPTPAQVLPWRTGNVPRQMFTRVAQAAPHLASYTAYRLECGLRSSAILGFVGMPTLGFYLESAFAQGDYSQVGLLLITFYILIATLRLWARPRLVLVYVIAAPFLLGDGLPIVWGNAMRFFGHDIVPAPLRGDTADWAALGDWLWELLAMQALPGLLTTMVLTQIALGATGFVALLT